MTGCILGYVVNTMSYKLVIISCASVIVVYASYISEAYICIYEIVALVFDSIWRVFYGHVHVHIHSEGVNV